MIRTIVALLALGLVSSGWAQTPDRNVVPATPEWLVEATNTSDGMFVLHWRVPGEISADYYQLEVKKGNQRQQINLIDSVHEFGLTARGAYWFTVKGCWRTEFADDVCGVPSERLRVTHSNASSKSQATPVAAKSYQVPQPSAPSVIWIDQAAKKYRMSWSWNWTVYYGVWFQVQRHYTPWLYKLHTATNTYLDFDNVSSYQLQVRAVDQYGTPYASDWTQPIASIDVGEVTGDLPAGQPANPPAGNWTDALGNFAVTAIESCEGEKSVCTVYQHR